jgi:hypothetical protein
MSNLRRYLDSGRLKRQPTSRSEIESLFKVVDRDLADAAVTGISADRRFATAYNAALQLATIGAAPDALSRRAVVALTAEGLYFG